MMKTFLHIAFIFIIIMLVVDCKKEPLKVAPSVTMTPVSNITAVSVSTGGNVTADGGSPVTERGICWSSTNKTPTTSDGTISSGAGTGSYTSQITGLTPGTTYYVSAFAKNSIGTSYSSASTFMTLATAPHITSTELSSITATTAVSGGTITTDGGSPVTARGVCWSTNQNPTIADNKTTDGTGVGNFTSSMTNLTSGTTYYVRAYATNSIGTIYGDGISLRTLSLKNYLLPSYDLRKTDLWVDYISIPKANGLNLNNQFAYGCPEAIADFNGDGFDDILMAPSRWVQVDQRQPLELYVNSTSNQSFRFDNSSIKENIGTINSRKGIVGDFNKDGKPDVIYADQGVDLPPFPCAEQSLLISSPNGYVQKLLSTEKWFGHGVCSGDVDNDGDLDLFFTNHFKPYDYLFLNDGAGNFTLASNFIKFPSSGVYTCEMRDINKDGYIDLITGGYDEVNGAGSQPSRIYWGNGHDYDAARSTPLPTILGWGMSLDFNFKDIDNDGLEEIIVNRTQDNSNGKNYVGYRVQILKNTGNYLFQDITDKIIQNYSDVTVQWIIWLRVQDIDKNGKLDIFDSDKGHYGTGKSIRWEQDTDGIFKRK